MTPPTESDTPMDTPNRSNMAQSDPDYTNIPQGNWQVDNLIAEVWAGTRALARLENMDLTEDEKIKLGNVLPPKAKPRFSGLPLGPRTGRRH